LTGPACRRASIALLAVAGGLGLAGASVSACSASSASGTAEDAGEEDSGPGLSLISDASFDGPIALRVKGELDQVCGSPDGCHGAGAGTMGIHIGSEFTDMINVTSSENPPMKRVLPGDPLNSYVFLKLRCEGGIVGACMPLGNPNAETAQLFHDWIEAGAPTQ
jgi:hypothetical protein